MMGCRVVVLGSGTSYGDPIPRCTCEICASLDRRDWRRRVSVCIFVHDGPTILIDFGPDIRKEILSASIKKVDVVLLTHEHADHCHGAYDLLALIENSDVAVVPIYGTTSAIAEVHQRCPEIATSERVKWIVPDGPFNACGVDIVPIPVIHGRLGVLGYRVGEFGYVTDVSFLPESSRLCLNGVKELILGALDPQGFETHFSFRQAADEWMKIEPRPRSLFWTHIDHYKHVDAEQCGAAIYEELGLGPMEESVIGPAWDGLVLNI